MATVKRMFSIPESVSSELDETIPNQERSKFITTTLTEALRRKKKEALLSAIDNIKSWQNDDGLSAVELIRQLREQETEKLTANG